MSDIKKRSNYGNLIWSLVSIVLLILLILKFFVYQQVTVVGSSMSPNYSDGQLLMVNQLSKEFDRGQVVAVYADDEVAKNADYFTRFSARFFLKRIVGLPGEEIEIVDSKVIIYNQDNPQGAILNESYIDEETKNTERKRNYYFERTEIPNDKYFVMGDNRSNSTDSRSSQLGPVHDYAVFGAESFRFWPVKSVEVFDLPEYTFSPVSEEILERKEEILTLASTDNARNFRFRIND